MTKKRKFSSRFPSTKKKQVVNRFGIKTYIATQPHGVKSYSEEEIYKEHIATREIKHCERKCLLELKGLDEKFIYSSNKEETNTETEKHIDNLNLTGNKKGRKNIDLVTIKNDTKVKHYVNAFVNLPLSDHIQKLLREFSCVDMSPIQVKCLPDLLNGKDLIALSKPTFDKILAFVVAIVSILEKMVLTNDICAIVVTPTREAAMHIYGLFRNFLQDEKYTCGVLIEGKSKITDFSKNLIVATPSVLLHLIQLTKGSHIRNLQLLVLDELDYILDYEPKLPVLLKLCPKKRQTVIFTSSLSRPVLSIVKKCINPRNFVYVSSSTRLMTSFIQHGYIVIPTNQRFIFLYTLLNQYCNYKIMVVFSSYYSVKFHSDLFNCMNIPVFTLHGQLTIQTQRSTLEKFTLSSRGILFLTDMTVRVMNIPYVHWMIQYDPPDYPEEYTCRRLFTKNMSTKAILFLGPKEKGVISSLMPKSIQYDIPQQSKNTNILKKVQKLVQTSYHLNTCAKDAYRGYLLSYAYHSHSQFFNISKLDLTHLGLSFGFKVPPRVDLS